MARRALVRRATPEALHGRGINYQQAMHATAQDIDATAVHMAYVQCSLLHIPAVVIWGDTLALVRTLPVENSDYDATGTVSVDGAQPVDADGEPLPF